jgi:GTPase
VKTKTIDHTTDIPVQRAVCVRPIQSIDGVSGRDPNASLLEAVGLAEALDLEVVAARLESVRRVNAATYFGTGRVEELRDLIEQEEASVLVFDGALAPNQQRNLEKALNAKVLDRTGLILEIFGLRARTKEGRLQVELARLKYERTRLVRTWTHLERQRGGVGVMGGPGESQLEIDRRLIADRIIKLERQLEEVRRTRGLQRNGRTRAGLKSVALVGYTNAGKSTLFNALTGATAFAKDMLFATLDPTTRAIELPDGQRFVLSDTVGFISDLPTELVASFRATLEEVNEADLLLHVRDVANDETEHQRDDVLAVLAEMGVGEGEGPSVVEVWNKADLLPPSARLGRGARAETDPEAILVSAQTGEGLSDLLKVVDQHLNPDRQRLSVTLRWADGATRAWLYENGEVLAESETDTGISLEVLLRASLLNELATRTREDITSYPAA